VVTSEIINGTQEEKKIILETTKSSVAAVAEKAANRSRVVIVIHSQFTMAVGSFNRFARDLRLSANGTETALGVVHGLVFFPGQSIFEPKNNVAIECPSAFAKLGIGSHSGVALFAPLRATKATPGIQQRRFARFGKEGGRRLDEFALAATLACRGGSWKNSRLGSQADGFRDAARNNPLLSKPSTKGHWGDLQFSGDAAQRFTSEVTVNIIADVGEKLGMAGRMLVSHDSRSSRERGCGRAGWTVATSARSALLYGGRERKSGGPQQ
jgi:hypothetical protein